ncbi:hypothetical protein EG339_03980 [Chryseobacterium bernardetii]|uniref:Uncharacterized protein n=1 Tax=Chryseobacterium bernardetii TaxID=1241978 RepID=A0A3G6TCP4_9FLAO|nr:hypothetical protein [Chryseobacterium bernardetii]AZB23830.1 hypothetical protein EG339_03980 [Chryseobacterium bernardetii]
MGVLEDYNVSFGIDKINDKEYKFIRSSMGSAIGHVFADLENLDKSISLLSLVNNVTINQSEVNYITNGLDCIVIKSSVITIYSGEDYYIDIKDAVPMGTLPTEDFKDILLAWIDFLKKGVSFKDYILKEYKVAFSIHNNNGMMVGRCSSKNEFLDKFIEKLISNETLNELLDLIKFIERHNHAEKAFSIPGSKQVVELGQTVKIFSNTAHLDGALVPDYTLPLSDFKEFILEWKDFLSKNRLNEI